MSSWWEDWERPYLADRHYGLCNKALEGEIPPTLDLSKPEAIASVIYGIRRHLAFAMSHAVSSLCARDAKFYRARNARLIMSGVIPEPEALANPEHHPYCIWHPDVAPEETYRQVAARFPALRYHVGRACAAAGYADLFAELDLLPEVSITEEARESGTEGGRAIYDAIMAAPVRYAVFDDDSLCVQANHPRAPAFLNGNTMVRRLLLQRRSPSELGRVNGDPDPYGQPNIEEDEGVGLCNDTIQGHEVLPVPEDGFIPWAVSRFLYSPLPPDLPMLQKGLLLCMAAYDGNIDRYARLCRLRFVRSELVCVLRGIYYHTMFARWWATELEQNTPRVQWLRSISERHVSVIRDAIMARRIMVNDLRGLAPDLDIQSAAEIDAIAVAEGRKISGPYLLWHPTRPQRTTLYDLAKFPSMSKQAAVAAIMLNYEEEFTAIDPEPTENILLAASIAPNPFYRSYLDAKSLAATGSEIKWGNLTARHDSDSGCIQRDLEPTHQLRHGCRLPDYVKRTLQTGFGQDGPFGGEWLDTGDVEHYVWTDEEFIRGLEEDELTALERRRAIE